MAPHLFVVGTRGTGILSWIRHGMFDREMAIYRRYSRDSVPVTFIAADRPADALVSPLVRPARILARQPGESMRDFEARVVSRITATPGAVIKTNQMRGARWAADVARRSEAPLLLRCGYSLSFHAAQEHGVGSEAHEAAVQEELDAVAQASWIMATTARILDPLVRHPHSCRATVVPNYVDVDRFHPRSKPRPDADPLVLSIGRLAEQKNYACLIAALEGIPAHLRLVGRGPLKPSLQRQAAVSRIHLRISRPVPHRRLPRLHNSAAIYAQPSLYEGHPKALLEAMASGLPVVGTRVPGIEEVIRDAETGRLVDVRPGDLGGAIRELLSDPDEASRLGHNARQYVMQNCSLQSVYEQERAIVATLSEDT